MRMMDCQLEAAMWVNNRNGNIYAGKSLPCWGDPNLPDQLDEGDLDMYTQDIADFGPKDERYPRIYNAPTIRNKWKRRAPGHTRLIQLAFHDCVRYEDGTGGCDGCLNWSGMGYVAPNGAWPNKRKPEYRHAFPQTKSTTNNKLQMSARSLEFIYTLTDWPPGAPSLPESLKESGKSRADLWQFAGNVALELGINYTNPNCHESYQAAGTPNYEQQITVIEGRDQCEMKQTRPLPFRWGRIDCIPDEDKKWTPYPFEATKKERHSNTYGTGTQVIKDLKRDFNMTARETISLMALHGLNTHTKIFEEAFKYKWIGGLRIDNTSYPGTPWSNARRGTFSNMYYKILNGRRYDNHFGRPEDIPKNKKLGYHGYFVGDKNGYPVNGTGFEINCASMWNNTNGREKSGPCKFKPSHPGCGIPQDSDLQLRERCFEVNLDRRWYIQGCDSAELVERNGRLVQVGGPPKPDVCTNGGNGIAMPYEVGFVIDLETFDNIPRGCGILDSPWIKKYAKAECGRYCGNLAR